MSCLDHSKADKPFDRRNSSTYPVPKSPNLLFARLTPAVPCFSWPINANHPLLFLPRKAFESVSSKNNLLPSHSSLTRIILFAISLLYFSLNIHHHELTLTTDEMHYLNFATALIESHRIEPGFFKPIPVIIALINYPFPPKMYEFLVSIFSSILVLYIFKVSFLLFGIHVAIAASFLVLINPMTLYLTLSGSSSILQSAFIMVSLYHILRAGLDDRRSILMAATFMSLAGLARHDTWFLLLPILFSLVVVKKNRNVTTLLFSTLIILLAPILWWTGEYFVNGDPFYPLSAAEDYIRHVDNYTVYAASAFPKVAYQLLTSNYLPDIFLFAALIGLLGAFRKYRNESPMPEIFFTLLLGFWWLSAKGIPTVGRYFFVHFVLIAIYSAEGFRKIVAWTNWERRSFAAIIIILAVGVFYIMSDVRKTWDAHSLLYRNATATRDVEESCKVLSKELEKGRDVTILLSARRGNFARFYLKSFPNVRFIFFREVYADRNLLGDYGIDWIIWNYEDLFPPTAKRYYLELLRDREKLAQHRIRVSQVWEISRYTLLLRLER